MAIDYVRAPSKKSLLAMLKKAREITPRLLRSLFDGVVFKSEMQDFVASGGVDHGALTGLTDDDHTQYLLLTAGSGRVLTGDLYLEKANPYLVMRDTDGNAGSHFIFEDLATETGTIRKTAATGDASVTIDAKPTDGTGEARVRMFRGTNTTGANSGLYLHYGNNSATVQHEFLIKGDADVCKEAGWLSVDGDDVVTASRWLQNGFPDASEASIAWDDGTRTLTLDSVGASFNYYIDGVLYNETGALTETIPSAGVGNEEGLWVFYLDSEGSISSVLNPSESAVDTVIEAAAIIAYVYWDDTNLDGRLMYELHGSNMAPATHHWIHDNIGAVYKSGMALADFTISTGGADVDAQFSIASGKFYDEDIEHDLAAFLSTEGVEIWYLDGSDWRWSETTITGTDFNIKVAGTGRMAYNNSGAQSEIDQNKFGLCHIFATNITDDTGSGPLYISIQGQAEYATIALARVGAETEINTIAYGTLPLQEVVPVGTVILQTGNYANKVKSKVVQTAAGDNYVDWRSSNIRASGGSVSDHGSLAGLADDDHPTVYLNFAAGSTRPLTGDLYIDSAATPAVFCRIAGDASNYSVFQDGGTFLSMAHVDAGNSQIYIDAAASDNSSTSTITMFGVTETSGVRKFEIEDGTAVPAVQHTFNAGDGDVDLCQQAGQVTIGGTAGAEKLTVTGDASVSTTLKVDTVTETTADAGVTLEGLLHKDSSIRITVKNGTGSAMAARDLAYISGDDAGTPNVILTDANAEATASKMLVVIAEAIANGATGEAVTYGKVTGFSGLTAAAIQYVHTTAGDFTETAPSGTADIVRVAGYALSTTVIFFNPGGSWVEVA